MKGMFGLTGNDLISFEAISLAAGHAKLWKLSDSEAPIRLGKIFEYVNFSDEVTPELIANAWFTQCQNRLLEEREVPLAVLRRLEPFNLNYKESLFALLEAYQEGGEPELYATYEEILEDPDWHRRSSLTPRDEAIIDLQIAAFEKYRTVENANYLIETLGTYYVANLTTDEFLDWIEVRRTRPGLDDQGMLGLIVCSIACGDLEKINLGDKQAYELLSTFLTQTLSGQDDGSRRIDGFIARTQDALMAYRKEDFLFIQSEPPFRTYARSNLQEFAGLWREHRIEEVRRRYSAMVRDRG